ncbi:response regulator transcription factor [Pseudonocardia eucalypti]|uniref:Response regulator transcription factor n=1 Tax=Pseudonocardia eucalypti TaxID=648755 RepID=A0ABP9RCW7_9PSEU|nr:two-component system OmpR family response regulator [Pseudonocardia eucalypti]
MSALTIDYAVVATSSGGYAGADHPADPERAAARNEGAATPAEPSEPGSILVIGDDHAVAELVPACLRFAGFRTVLARGADEALARAERHRPELLVLDATLPGVDASALARLLRLRLGSGVPILFLVGGRGGEHSAMSLTVGGDDYLPKPFSLDELTARIRALLRRFGRRSDAVLSFADLEFDEDTLEPRRAGRHLYLTPQERRILRYLLVNAGRVITRTEIVEHVWPYDHVGHRRVLDVHMCTLRRKINKMGPPLIHTMHGVGYVLRDPRANKR